MLCSLPISARSDTLWVMNPAFPSITQRVVLDNLSMSAVSDGQAEFVLPYETTKTLIGVAYDAEGTFGMLVRNLMTVNYICFCIKRHRLI
ncbi:MAG: hypothetical protein ACI3ZG_03850 [Candidatus Coprenecus sp.]